MSPDFVAAVLILTLVTDPFGNVPLVNAMLVEVPASRRRAIILRECAIAFVTLGLFMVAGRQILELMQLSQSSLSIAGGVILFMIAIRMVFGNPEGIFGTAPKGEPFIVPLAIPMIAGPSALATVMLMATREPHRMAIWGAALVVAMAFCTVVLLAGERMQRSMGPGAMQAVERLMGLILTAMAVEMLLGGIRSFVKGFG